MLKTGVKSGPLKGIFNVEKCDQHKISTDNATLIRQHAV